jgi:hypothetical protein
MWVKKKTPDRIAKRLPKRVKSAMSLSYLVSQRVP